LLKLESFAVQILENITIKEEQNLLQQSLGPTKETGCKSSKEALSLIYKVYTLCKMVQNQ